MTKKTITFEMEVSQPVAVQVTLEVFDDFAPGDDTYALIGVTLPPTASVDKSRFFEHFKDGDFEHLDELIVAKLGEKP